MILSKEDLFFINHIKDLQNTAKLHSYMTHSDFLSEYEQSLACSVSKGDLLCRCYGGYEFAERKMVLFYPDTSYDYGDLAIPISVLHIEPLQVKFMEKLTHRDYLGALLNLGIDRGKIGDILVFDAYCDVFCLESIADFIVDELVRIKHTNIKTTIIDTLTTPDYKPNLKEKSGSIHSLRLDVVIAFAYHMSRTKATDLILQEKVLVNHQIQTNTSYQLKENDTISTRGFGKFKFENVIHHTKKERLYVRIWLYQ